MTTIRNTWKDALRVSSLPGTTRAILLYLADRMDGDGGNCFPSTKRIAEETGFSERTVCTHIHSARKAGWLATKNFRRGQSWKSHQYLPAVPTAPDLDNHPKATEEPSAANSDNPAQATEIIDGKLLKELQSTSSLTPSIVSTAENTEIPRAERPALSAPPDELPFSPPATAAAQPESTKPKKRKDQRKLTDEERELAYEGHVVRLNNFHWRGLQEKFGVDDDTLTQLMKDRDEWLRTLPEDDERRLPGTWFWATKQWLAARTQRGDE